MIDSLKDELYEQLFDEIQGGKADEFVRFIVYNEAVTEDEINRQVAELESSRKPPKCIYIICLGGVDP